MSAELTTDEAALGIERRISIPGELVSHGNNGADLLHNVVEEEVGDVSSRKSVASPLAGAKSLGPQ